MGNLNYDTREYDLEDFFQGYGIIYKIKISYCRDGKSKGFAHVTFKYYEDAMDALDNLNGEILDGRALRLDDAGVDKSSYTPKNRHDRHKDYDSYSNEYNRDEGFYPDDNDDLLYTSS